jgi:hypothetical protein
MAGRARNVGRLARSAGHAAGAWLLSCWACDATAIVDRVDGHGATIEELEPPWPRLLFLDAARPGHVPRIPEQGGEVDRLVARQAADGDEGRDNDGRRDDE